MKVDLLELVNIIMIFQLLVFTVFLFVKKNNHLSNYLFGLHLFSQAAGIFTGLGGLQRDFFFNIYPHLALTGYPFVFLWGPTFYLYVKSISYSDFKIKPAQLLHALPCIFSLVVLSFSFYFNDAGTKRNILNDPSFFFFSEGILIDLFLRVQVLVYIILSLLIFFEVRKRLKENYSSINKMNLSWLGFVVIGYTICYLISVVFIYTNFFLGNFSRYMTLGTFMQFFIYFNIIFFRAWSEPWIFHRIEESGKYKHSSLKKDEGELWKTKLAEYVSLKKPYLNPELTLNQLAEEININPKILSQVINEYFNRNFYDYTNGLRIEEAKRMLLDPGNKKNVLEILYETGFNSKATFNRAFKKETGLPPTEYKKKYSGRQSGSR